MAAGGFGVAGVAGVAGVQIGGGAGVQIGGGAGGGLAGACAGQENVVANGIGGAAPMANAGVVGFGFGFSFADQPLVSHFSSVAKRLVSHFSCSAQPLVSHFSCSAQPLVSHFSSSSSWSVTTSSFNLAALALLDSILAQSFSISSVLSSFFWLVSAGESSEGA